MLFTTVPIEKARVISPITLAFVGDAVYTLFVRGKLVESCDRSAHVLQKMSSALVSAHGQNALSEEIAPHLTEEELAVFKRGRNAKKPTRSKNATVAEYNNSTGFEALIGFLYLSGQYGRLEEILSYHTEKL